jgi:hypothetical protein
MAAMSGAHHRRSHPENDIQRTVFAHLRQRRAPGVIAFHAPNGGKRKPIEAAIMKGLGVLAGVPDVLAVKNGQLYALELKADGGRLTPNQVAVHEAMRQAGAFVCTTYGLNEAIARLGDWGLLRGSAS